MAKIIASNPASILIVIGAGLYAMGNALGPWLIGAGIAAHFVWLLR